MINYNKIIIDGAIYIRVFYYGTVSYLIYSTDNVLNTTNTETEFSELRRVLEESFEMKFQEGSVLRLVPAQDVHFFYTRSHLSALQNCALLFSINFQLIFIFKNA